MNQAVLEQQLVFLAEIDKLKSVQRQTVLMDGSRQENSAEHSWHVVLMAIVLRDYSARAIDIDRVTRMLAIHDIVEVFAGDTFFYDEEGIESQREREQEAAGKIFSLLPIPQSSGLHLLWEEFEAAKTADAKYAKAIDRIQPMLQNLASQCLMWRKHGITVERIRTSVRSIIEPTIPAMWPIIDAKLEDAVQQGWLQ